ncbi:MAG: LEA type 2 family protein [Flavobacteriales bacterium]|nr:LEA type 2 family protein [Flavobacteriales bacterium]
MLLPLFLLLCISLSSCLSYKQVELIDVTNIQVERMDAKGIAVRVDAVVNNPNNYRIHAQDPDVDLYVNGKFVGKGVLDSALTLQKKSTQVYSVPMRAELQGGALLMVLLSGVFGGNEMKLAAKGTVVGRVGLLRKRFPFEFEERVQY